MRLTHVKLAGFKSFVDPTAILTPGQLVGIVGPNGCGKSNVIDAVRWVLGESRASALRGESMQDVIFNGAGERKPVGRASVELVFDNSLGRITGQWGQYAEIAIKRVLQRDGESSYYINNIAVRRRDIQDLFLGTGLGPRAYAIIEQGMISRIIEAKPEELRVFLEEAAGVSKYKERRRETENRIADTRENLLRVEDIRTELGQQLERLDGQARVATEYRELETKLRETQHMLWYGRQQEAARQRQRAVVELTTCSTELEALQARIRAQESDIERQRADHYAASDQLHERQGEFYATNSEVTRLEQQLAFQRESEERLGQQIAQLDAREAGIGQELAQLALEEASATQALETARVERERCDAEESIGATALPALDDASRAAGQGFTESQARAAAAEQALKLAETNRDYRDRTIQQLVAREARLGAEETELATDSAPAQQAIDQQLAAEREELFAHEMRIGELNHALGARREQERALRAQSQAARERQTGVEARIAALAALQAKLGREERTAAWLDERALANATRLWREVGIAPGWEDALEAVLRERLNAIHVADLDSLGGAADMPGRLSLYTGSGREVGMPPADSLLARLEVREPHIATVLATWLHGVRCARDLTEALQRRHELGPYESWVTPAGHVVTTESVTTFAPDSDLHGVLARQRELDDLQREVARLQVAAVDAQAAFLAAEASVESAQHELASETTTAGSLQRRCHDLEVELVQVRQAAEAAQARRVQIRNELDEVRTAIADERAGRDNCDAEVGSARAALASALQDREVLRHRRNEAEVGLVRARDAQRGAERAAQEARFAERSAADRIAELGRRRAGLERQRDELAGELALLRGDRDRVDWAPLKNSLEVQLGVRHERERALAAAREHLETAGQTLRAAEEERQRLEHQVEPTRARMEELRLKEQAAMLSEQQFTEMLAGDAAEVSALPELLLRWGRVSTLPAEIERIQKAIGALGAVNLAALDELKATTERKDYLDAQAADLAEALETLENAIRRIDRETRELLQTTFDQVNIHFGKLFPTLFGGGMARLELTGEEILDAGIHVIAQPPGKRNTSIHLLSGGEKALTALSLVFAIFQLNPAPFCLLDEVDAPLDDTNTERFCSMVREMSRITQFLYVSHNKITMEMASHLIGITMPEPGMSRVVAVDISEAIELARAA